MTINLTFLMARSPRRWIIAHPSPGKSMIKEVEMVEVKTGEAPKQDVVPQGRRHRLAPFGDFERMVEEIFRSWPARFEHRIHPMLNLEEKLPTVDVIDAQDNVIIRAELPGVDKKDVDVSVSDQTATIKAESKNEKEETKGDYFRREIQRGAYYRSIALPAEVDGSRAKATFKDGILEVTLPKLEEAKRQSIKVD